MKTKGYRIGAFLMGLGLCLLILEILLRAVGLFYVHLSESDPAAGTDSQGRILCVGDSVTFGLGAPARASYPAQLQTLLDKSHPEWRFTVINRGRPGQNSAQLLQRVERYLQEFRPQVVTILTGAQNLSNFAGYKASLARSTKPEEREQAHHVPLFHDTFDNIRIYKFMRLLLTNVLKPAAGGSSGTLPPGGNDPGNGSTDQKVQAFPPEGELDPEIMDACLEGRLQMENGDYEGAIKTLSTAIKQGTANTNCYSFLGDVYREREQFDEALYWYEQGLDHNNAHGRTYEGLGWLYIARGDFERALGWFKRMLAVIDPEMYYEYTYTGLTVCFQQLGLYDEAVELFKGEAQKNPLARDYMHIFKGKRIEKEIEKWVSGDIDAIINLCARYGAKVILQGYPRQNRLNRLFGTIADQHRIPFVNHNHSFENILKDEQLEKNFFVADGHPNASGYAIMAKNLLRCLKTELFP